MLTEKRLDEIYEEVKEKRKMIEEGIAYVKIRQIVEEVLKEFTAHEYGEIVKYIVITINCTGPTAWYRTEGRGLKKEYGRFNLKEREYLINLLQKYFEIEEPEEDMFCLKIK